MINLLPPDIRQATSYARKNTALQHLAIGLVLLLCVFIIIFLGGLIFLKQTTQSLKQQVETSKTQLSLQDQEKIKKQVEDLSSSLKLVVQVLSKQVLFSKLIRQVGSVMPSGSVLTGLSISETSGGIDLQATAIDYDTATQVQVNLQDPKSLLFEKVDIISIQCQTESSGNTAAGKYPCTVQMRALFTKTNPFLFTGGGVKP